MSKSDVSFHGTQISANGRVHCGDVGHHLANPPKMWRFSLISKVFLEDIGKRERSVYGGRICHTRDRFRHHC